jgi:anthranilate phosphoribosyltransferase
MVGGRVDDLAEGVALAGALIDSGEAMSRLERLVAASLEASGR